MEALHIASILMVEYRRHAKKNITASITEMKKRLVHQKQGMLI
jgi:hypothetical protein